MRAARALSQPLGTAATPLALVALLSLLLLLLAPVTRAAYCEDVGLDAPSVVTLLQSPTNASEAVVLAPNCSATTRSVHDEDGDQVLRVDTLGIEHVDSYPSTYRMCDRVASQCCLLLRWMRSRGRH